MNAVHISVQRQATDLLATNEWLCCSACTDNRERIEIPMPSITACLIASVLYISTVSVGTAPARLSWRITYSRVADFDWEIKKGTLPDRQGRSPPFAERVIGRHHQTHFILAQNAAYIFRVVKELLRLGNDREVHFVRFQKFCDVRQKSMVKLMMISGCSCLKLLMICGIR